MPNIAVHNDRRDSIRVPSSKVAQLIGPITSKDPIEARFAVMCAMNYEQFKIALKEEEKQSEYGLLRATTLSGMRLVHYAAHEQHFKQVLALVKKASKSGALKSFKTGETILHFLSMQTRVNLQAEDKRALEDIISRTIEFIDAQTSGGKTALYLATYAGSIPIIDALLSAGALTRPERGAHPLFVNFSSSCITGANPATAIVPILRLKNWGSPEAQSIQYLLSTAIKKYSLRLELPLAPCSNLRALSPAEKKKTCPVGHPMTLEPTGVAFSCTLCNVDEMAASGVHFVCRDCSTRICLACMPTPATQHINVIKKRFVRSLPSQLAQLTIWQELQDLQRMCHTRCRWLSEKNGKYYLPFTVRKFFF